MMVTLVILVASMDDVKLQLPAALEAAGAGAYLSSVAAAW